MKKFKIESKPKIAICMHGQWRTGDTTVPYISDIINRGTRSAFIDVFCVIKGEYDNDNEESRVLDKITNSGLNPVDYKFIPLSEDKKLYGHSYRNRTPANMYSLSSSILLKSLYEIKYGFTYDIVIFMRYDCYYQPLELINYISQWYINMTDEEYTHTFSNRLPKNSRFFVSDIQSFEQTHRYTVVRAGFHDLLMWMDSNTANKLMFEFMMFTSNLHHVNNTLTTLRKPGLLHLHNQHSVLFNAIQNTGTPYSESFPIFGEDKDVPVGVVPFRTHHEHACLDLYDPTTFQTILEELIYNWENRPTSSRT